MAVAREVKVENSKQLHEELAEVPHAILVDFKGLNVEGATDLRRKLREGDARLKVVKNTTALRAVEELPLAELNDVFVGQTAIAYTDGDAVALAKVLREFHKEFETPNFKAGVVDGVPISAEDFEALAKLPPREDLIAKTVFLMNSPLAGLATALNGILQGFVVALEQIRDKKESGELPSGEDAPVEAAAEAAADEAPAEETAEAAADEAPAEEAEAAADEAPAEETAEAAAEEAPAEEAAAEEAADDAPAEEEKAEEAVEAAAEEPAEEAAEESGDAEEAAEDTEDEEK